MKIELGYMSNGQEKRSVKWTSVDEPSALVKCRMGKIIENKTDCIVEWLPKERLVITDYITIDIISGDFKSWTTICNGSCVTL